ncbi:hypothetical protein Tco_1186370 [Tanacetum coccineum]
MGLRHHIPTPQGAAVVAVTPIRHPQPATAAAAAGKAVAAAVVAAVAWEDGGTRFTNPELSDYMTAFPEISRRARDKYYNLEDDEMVKSVFNLGKNKDGVGMKIPNWMIPDEIKLTENYRMYDAVFGVDVPTPLNSR